MKCITCTSEAEFMYRGNSYCHGHLVETKERNRKTNKEFHEYLDKLSNKYQKRIEDGKKDG